MAIVSQIRVSYSDSDSLCDVDEMFRLPCYHCPAQGIGAGATEWNKGIYDIVIHQGIYENTVLERLKDLEVSVYWCITKNSRPRYILVPAVDFK